MLREFEISLLGVEEWKPLPCRSITVSKNASTADDSVFESMFQSGQTTLLGWNVETELVLKSQLGFQASIFTSGSEIPSYRYELEFREPNEDTTLMLDFINQTYILNSDAVVYHMNLDNRYIDYKEQVVVEDGTTDITDQVVFIDYLNNAIVLENDYVVQDTLYITCNTISLVNLCFANDFSVSESNELQDVTTFEVAQDNNGHRIFKYGRTSAEVSLSGFDQSVSADILAQQTADKKPVILAFNVGGNSIKGFFMTTQVSRDGESGGVEALSSSHTLHTPLDYNEEALKRPFSWKVGGKYSVTALDDICIASENRTPIKVRYTYKNGLIITGDAYIESKALNNNVEEMPSISLTLRGSGVLHISKENNNG